MLLLQWISVPSTYTSKVVWFILALMLFGDTIKHVFSLSHHFQNVFTLQSAFLSIRCINISNCNFYFLSRKNGRHEILCLFANCTKDVNKWWRHSQNPTEKEYMYMLIYIHSGAPKWSIFFYHGLEILVCTRNVLLSHQNLDILKNNFLTWFWFSQPARPKSPLQPVNFGSPARQF